VNIALDIFNGIINDIFDKHAPTVTKKTKGRRCEWITAELKIKMDRRDKALRRARKSNDHED